MSEKLLIKGGRVVTAVDDYVGDVLIEDGKIAAVGRSLPVDGARRIDAKGKLVMPGGIDVHTHLDMPFGGTTASDDFETGTKAAAWGGTTTIVDFAIQSKGMTLRQGWEAWMRKAEGKAAIDYGFHLIITDLPESLEPEMDQMVREGITSFKLFTAYRGVLMLDDGSIFRALARTADNGGTVCMHAENGDVIDVLVRRAVAAGNTAPKFHAKTRPAWAEAEATNRTIRLAEMAGAPLYIVHLTAAEALEKVAEARGRGLPIMAETCPQYLFLSDDRYEERNFGGAKYVMSPPLRPKGNEEALWRGLEKDDLSVVSTDHCPFFFKTQKTMGKDNFARIPNGAPGIETRMMLLWDGGVNGGRISPNRFVELTATAPAKIFGLFPKKGTIAPGSDADVVVFDPKKKVTLSAKTLHQRVDYTPYEGITVTGAPDAVVSRGEVLVAKGTASIRAGRGAFLRRSPRT